jgi:hypothetical protein
MDRTQRVRTASTRQREADAALPPKRRAVSSRAERHAVNVVSEDTQDSPLPSGTASDAASASAIPSASPAPPAGSSAAEGMAALAAAAEPPRSQEPPPSSQQSVRRQHGNWRASEDAELCRLAEAFQCSWSVVLQHSPLLMGRHRTIGACSKRYAALKQQAKRRAQRAPLAAQGMAPDEVGPQSADPGEGLHQVSDWNALEPIDRSVHMAQTMGWD